MSDADPPVPQDGTCAQCGRPRHPEKAHTKAVRELAALDPWCSSACARLYFGCPLPELTRANQRTRRIRKHSQTKGRAA